VHQNDEPNVNIIMREEVKLRKEIAEAILSCNLKLCSIAFWFACSFNTKEEMWWVEIHWLF
jgi:hypothetical protein